MKVLLINPSLPRSVPCSVRVELRYDPPLAAIHLASFLENNDISCDILDTAIDDLDIQKIRSCEYGLISFTVFIGEFMKKAKELSTRIKKSNKNIPIVFGGVMASIFPEMILKEYPADFVVRYEGEHTLHELVRYLEGKIHISDIRGLSYRSGDTVIHNPPRYLENDLDAFPVPRWELLKDKCNARQVPYYFSIMTSKGCPFKCSFCYNRQVEESILLDSPVWRYRSARHVIKEIDHIHELTGTRVFTIGDDNFLVNRERAITILDYFRQRKFFIEQCIGHMNNFNNDELINHMGGTVQTVIYALESGSPRLLKLLHKNLNIKMVPTINRKLFWKGITTIHNFIVGLPTETDSDLKMNVDLMMQLKEVNPYVRGNPYLYIPLPFTPLESLIIYDMGYHLPHTMDHFERARFDFEDGKKYRPWLDDERYSDLYGYCEIFKDVFQINNMTFSEQSLRLFDENPRLRRIFSNIENVRKPPVHYVPYVLDRVLKGEPIDLENDLIRRATGIRH